MDIIRGEPEVQNVLGREAAERVAAAIDEEEPTDLYRSIVSSQFDADRLDYLRRDRYMTGVEIGRFDYDWICGSLLVADIHVGEGDDAETYTTVRSLVLGPKAFKAAEGYLQARHQLYSSVYLHKTTRAAEKMLEGILFHASQRLQDGGKALPTNVREGPLATFLDGKRRPDLSLYLRLDDTAVWSFLDGLANEGDGEDPLGQLAGRLRRRQLYKCLQLDHLVHDQDTDRPLRLKQAVRSFAEQKGWQEGIDILYDDPSNSGYKWYDWTAGSALRKVLIKDEHNETIDVGHRSRIVRALEKERFYRVYLPDAERKRQVEAMVSEEFR
jgi:HD superfamily phosphohydrolase